MPSLPIPKLSAPPVGAGLFVELETVVGEVAAGADGPPLELVPVKDAEFDELGLAGTTCPP